MLRSTLALALALCLAPLAASAQPVVVSASPAAHAIAADRSAPVEVVFDRTLDPATVTAATVRVFGRWSGPAAGTLSVDGATLRFVPDAPFFAGEAVTVALSRGIRDGDGAALATGFAWGFWASAAPASLAITEVGQMSTRRPGEGSIISYGAYAGDLNDDGWSDLAIPNEAANDLRVFLNDGAGQYDTFVVHALPNGSVPSTNEGGDFNEDGLVDIAVGNIGNDRVSVMLGDGDGGFLDAASYRAGNSVRGVCVLDLDGDGHDDIATANRSASNVTLLRGLGDGTFRPPTVIETGADGETACAAADANGDGITDLFVGAVNSGEIVLLLGDGAGGLAVAATVEAETSPWMLAAGDIDGDGAVDVVAAGSFSDNVSVTFGDGAGGLSEPVLYPFGRLSVAIDLGDLDGDGDLDMLASNYSSRNFHLYENHGAGAFADPVAFSVSGNGSCAVFHDRDNDGDLDVTGIDEGDDRLYFYENPGATTNAEATPAADFSVALFPNPTHESATVRFAVATPSDVLVRVFDARGRLVETLVDGRRAAGEHTLALSTRGLASGSYVVRVETASGTVSRMLTLTR
ncbi:MAG: FG-GAP-like repeat-containing protein [Rhodothermales bacterium]